MFSIECTNNHTIEVVTSTLEGYDVEVKKTRHKKYVLFTVEDNGNSSSYHLCETMFLFNFHQKHGMNCGHCGTKEPCGHITFTGPIECSIMV